jgi:hypothetical protein
MRRIAAELRITRWRVKRIILDQQQGRAEGMAHPDLPTLPESRGSILDGHVPFIQELLARWPSITALRVHEELRDRQESPRQQRERHPHLEQGEAGTAGDGDRDMRRHYGVRYMRRGFTLTHLGALWRYLCMVFRKQYMGLDRAGI